MNNKLVLSLFATALVSAAAQGATASISASYNNLTNVVISVSGASANDRVSVRTVDGTEVAWTTIGSASGEVTPLSGSPLTNGVYYIITTGTGSGTYAGEFTNGVGVVSIFSATASGSTETKDGGDWAAGLAPTISSSKYTINGTAQFDVSAARPEKRFYSVDTVVNYTSFAEQDDLTSFDSNGSIAGIVAVSNDTTKEWRALTGASTWTPLKSKGSITPGLSTAYTLRAEFDFAPASPRVRYSVKTTGAFEILTNGNNVAWLTTASSSNKISGVVMTGSGGTVASLVGNIADTNLITQGSTDKGGLPTTGGGTFTLRTDIAGWKPTSGEYTVTKNGHSLSVPTIDTDGVKVVNNDSTVTISTAQYEALVNARENWTWLTNAVKKASAGSVVKAKVDVSPDVAWEASYAVLLDLDGKTLGGMAPTGTAALTISNGYLAVSSGTVGNGVKLASGQATDTAKGLFDSKLVSGHQFVQLLVSENHNGTMTYRVMPVTDSTNLKACLVNASGHKGYVAISNAWLSANGTIDTVEKVNANGENGIPKWQSYVLGLDPSKKGDQPYLVPVQVTTAGHMNVDVGGTRPSNSATGVKYVAVECDSPSGEFSGTADKGPGTKTDETLKSSVKYYRLKLELTPDPLSTEE